jgi:DNA-binding IclR family transcriptional regulator
MEKNTLKLNSTEKVVEVLLSFLENQESWGVRELATKHGIAPGTVQRIIKTLKKYNFLEQHPTSKKYQLGLIYFKFFNIVYTKNNVIKIVRSSMKTLNMKTNETICHHILKEKYNLCIDKIQPTDTLTVIKDIGNISHLYTGASSKCLLAFSSKEFIDDYLSTVKFTLFTKNTITNKKTLQKELQLIKSRGYANSVSEKNVGMASLSAPFFDYTGSLLGAISIDFLESKFYDDTHRDFCINLLLSTVKEISKKFRPA